MNTDEHRLRRARNKPFSYLCSSVFICGRFFCLLSLWLGVGCEKASSNEVVLYTSIDEPIARPIIDAFTKQTGIKVKLVTDSEANKTVGLVEKIRAEKDRPQADVWWGNEPFNSVLLAEEGLLLPYDSPAATDVPAAYRDPQKRWTGTAYRQRMLAQSGKFNREATIESFWNPAEKGRVAIARPTAGTTGSHVAALYVKLGEEKADAIFRAMHDNGVKVLGGNGPVAEAVSRGDVNFGLTDNDDCAAMNREHPHSVHSQPPAPPFDLVLPTTVGLVAGRPESTDRQKLVDYLVSVDVERKLVAAEFAAGSLRELKPADSPIDYAAVARAMPRAIRRATAILEGRE